MSTITSPRPSPASPAGPRPGPGSRALGPAASIDPFRVARRHALLLVASIFVGAAVGLAAWGGFLFLYPLYEARALFEVQQGITEAGDLSTRATGMKDEDVSRIARTELEVIIQRPILQSAARRPELQNTAWFRRHFADPVTGQPRVEDAVDELEKSLRPSAMRGTNLFQIGWLARERADAAVIVNEVARAYIERRRLDDESVYNVNLAAFDRQRGEVDGDLERLQNQINRLIIDSGITSLDDPRYTEAAQAVQRAVDTISQATVMMQGDATLREQILAKLRGVLAYSDEDVRLAETTDGAVYQHIRTVNDMRVEIRSLREKYPDDHRLVRLAEARLRAAEDELERQREDVIRRNLNARLKEVSDRIEQTRSVLGQQEKELEARTKSLADIATKQSEYHAMQDRRRALELSREALIQLSRDVRLMKTRDDARRTRVVAFAEEPRELWFPRIEIIVPIAVILVFGLTLGLVFVREITDQRVKSASDLLVIPGASILGVVPALEEDPTGVKSVNMVVRRAPLSVLAESWRQAATGLLRGLDAGGLQIVVVVGGMPGSGTTSAVTNLAAAIGASGRRVVVVDANFRRPEVARMLGLNGNAAGLGDLLRDAVTLEEALVQTEEGFAVIPAGTAASRIVERLNTERLSSLFAELRSRFDIVIVDAPPAIVAGDALALAYRADASVLVVRAGQEERGLVARVLGQLGRARSEVLGVVLNDAKRTAGGYFRKNFRAMAQYAREDAGDGSKK